MFASAWRKGLYRVAQRAALEQKPKFLVVAVTPVNFEKPCTQKLKGVRRVMKDTPPRPPRGNPGAHAAAVCPGVIGGSIHLLPGSDVGAATLVTRVGRQTEFEK
jgi:hypothetical protein